MTVAEHKLKKGIFSRKIGIILYILIFVIPLQEYDKKALLRVSSIVSW